MSHPWIGSRFERPGVRRSRRSRWRALIEPLELRRLLAFVVSNTADLGGGSLRQAVLDANANPGADVVTFAAGVSGTITLTSGQLSVTESLTITGPATGANQLTVAGNHTARVLEFTAGTSQISALAIINGTTSGEGGGVRIGAGASLTLTNCTVAGNVAATNGGGISNNGGSLTMIGCTVSDNTSNDNGGGIQSLGTGVTTTLTNCTISGNRCNTQGGGIRIANGTAILTDCTITTNHSNNDDGVFGPGGGLSTIGTTTLQNTIVAGNLRNSNTFTADDVDGSVTANFSLIGNTTGATIAGANNLLNVSPILGPLALNGGPTRTHAPSTGSPARDAGSAFGTTTDQRGHTRPNDDLSIANAPGSDGSDIGAVEVSKPTTTGIPPVTVNEDAANTNLNLQPFFDDGGAGGTGLNYAVQSNSNPGLFTLVDEFDGTLTLDYAPNAFGSANIVIRATNATGQFVDATLAVTVNAVNDAPSFSVDPDVIDFGFESLEDQGAVSAPVMNSTSPGPLNEAAQQLSFVVSNDNPGLFSVQPSISSSGTLSYTSAPNANGFANLTVRAKDDGGTDRGGQDTSPPNTEITIAVGAVNDAPLFTKGPNVTVLMGSGPYSAPWATGINPGGGADEVGQSVHFLTVGNSNPGLFMAPPTVLSDGSLTFTPAPGMSGTTTVMVRAQDDGGTFNGGFDTSQPQTFTITISGTNQAPTADSKSFAVNEDGVLQIALTGSDLETPAADLKFTITSLPTNGVLKSGGVPVTVGQMFTGSPTNLTYEPAGACDLVLPVSDGFAFTVTDLGAGPLPAMTAGGTIAITINPAVADGAVTLDPSGILRIGGTPGNDDIKVEDASGGTLIKVKMGGDTLLTTPVASVSEIRIWGRGGKDHIKVDPKVAVPIYVNGGGGDDDIDIKGGAAIVVGAGGKDHLDTNGPGSMLIGGAGTDDLHGEGKAATSKDVLIGGDVGCGMSLSDLRAALAGWAAGGPAFATSAAGAALVAAVVDTEKDDYHGGPGADWFIANPKPTDKPGVDTKKGDFLSLV